MLDKLFRKCLVIGIIILFIGAGFLPTISGTKEPKTTNDNELVEYIRFDDFEDYYVGETPKSSRGWTTTGVNQNQYCKAAVDPLNPSNMVMEVHNSNADPDTYCILFQENFAPAGEYIIHYRIYTPDLSMTHTVYESLYDDEQGNRFLVCVHRRPGQIRWGSDGHCGGYYEFYPPINPSTTNWVEEELRIKVEEFRILHAGVIDALGGYCKTPVGGVSTWCIRNYREFTASLFIDDFWITIFNFPPDTPEKPSGRTEGIRGEELTYTTYTYDPDDNQVLYKWDWGDGTYSNWLGPHDSGDLTSAFHSWEVGSYNIRVKAKDIHEYESEWSDSLTVTIKKGKSRVINTPFINFLQQYPNLFSILRHLLRL